MSDPTDPKDPGSTPEKAPSSLTLLRPPTSGGFKPGHDPRRAAAPRRLPKAKGSLAEAVRAATGGLADQIAFMVNLSKGLDRDGKPIQGLDLRLQIDAVKYLTDRGYGKAVETVVSAEAGEDPLDGLTQEEIRELARKHAKR